MCTAQIAQRALWTGLQRDLEKIQGTGSTLCFLVWRLKMGCSEEGKPVLSTMVENSEC